MAEFVEVMKQKERLCKSIEDCTQCVMSCDYNGIGCNCIEFFRLHPKEAEEIIMKWVKEHPLMTNADKFKEVFGFRPDKCPTTFCNTQKCAVCDGYRFWVQEYKEPENKGRGGCNK